MTDRTRLWAAVVGLLAAAGPAPALHPFHPFHHHHKHHKVPVIPVIPVLPTTPFVAPQATGHLVVTHAAPPLVTLPQVATFQAAPAATAQLSPFDILSLVGRFAPLPGGGGSSVNLGTIESRLASIDGKLTGIDQKLGRIDANIAAYVAKQGVKAKKAPKKAADDADDGEIPEGLLNVAPPPVKVVDPAAATALAAALTKLAESNDKVAKQVEENRKAVEELVKQFKGN